MTIREISFSECTRVSGANGNSNYEAGGPSRGGSRSNRSSNSNYGGIMVHSIPDTYENCIGWNMLGGAIAGSPGWIGGVIAGAIGGTIAGIGTCDKTGNGGGGGQASNSSCNDNSCSW